MVRVFIPQSHRPGQDAEVNFGDVCIDLAGVRTLCYRFVFRLSFSGKAMHRVSPPRAHGTENRHILDRTERKQPAIERSRVPRPKPELVILC